MLATMLILRDIGVIVIALGADTIGENSGDTPTNTDKHNPEKQ